MKPGPPLAKSPHQTPISSNRAPDPDTEQRRRWGFTPKLTTAASTLRQRIAGIQSGPDPKNR